MEEKIVRPAARTKAAILTEEQIALVSGADSGTFTNVTISYTADYKDTDGESGGGS